MLDNVSQLSASAAKLFMAPRHPGSLLLVTSWSADVFKTLRKEQLAQGQAREELLQDQAMTELLAAERLMLKPAEASSLLQQQVVRSMQPELPCQLTAYLREAEQALTFRRMPEHVPQVLAVCGQFLGELAHHAGRTAQQGSPVKLLLSLLAAAKEPVAPGSQPQSDLQLFSQLQVCYELLPPVTQQIFLDLARDQQAAASIKQRVQWACRTDLAHWLACRQHAPYHTWQALEEVSSLCLIIQASAAVLSGCGLLQVQQLDARGFLSIVAEHGPVQDSVGLQLHELMQWLTLLLDRLDRASAGASHWIRERKLGEQNLSLWSTARIVELSGFSTAELGHACLPALLALKLQGAQLSISSRCCVAANAAFLESGF